jgi:LuxR family maltose regulon positive regulatory protein
MTDSFAANRAAADPPASSGRSTEFVPTKLALPILRPGIVRRTALVNRLVGSQWTPYVDVTAPAGYGKTTLLAQWAARDSRPTTIPSSCSATSVRLSGASRPSRTPRSRP